MPRVTVIGDMTSPAAALRMARDGGVLCWSGDFHKAKACLAEMGRLLERSPSPRVPAASTPRDAFLATRSAAAARAALMSRLHVPVAADGSVPLVRAPASLAAAIRAAALVPSAAAATAPVTVPLREVLGAVGAHEWRRRGVPVPALGRSARVHPHYGVWSPVRQEHVELLRAEPFPPRGGGARTQQQQQQQQQQQPSPPPPPPPSYAWDVGTGTGVLACVLAARGVRAVTASDVNPRAVECARANAAGLGYRSVISGLPSRLHPDEPSEAWLLLSDLPERVGLRSRSDFLVAIERAGMRVRGRSDAPPRRSLGPLARGGVREPSVLREARAAEVVSLWRLGRA
jgi:hypothetical protein